MTLQLTAPSLFLLSEDEMQQNLATFLSPHGTCADDLQAEVEDVFGPPVLVIAAGSVIQGFGNSTSDIDLLVLVDNPDVTDFPITSFDCGPQLDITYQRSSWADESAASLDAGQLPSHEVRTRPEWVAMYRTLNKLSRLALGVPLGGTDDRLRWRAELRGPVLVEAISRWWRLEAYRRWCTARLLLPHKELLACQRYVDACFAALDSALTERGQAYFGQKWAGAKVAATGDDHLILTFRELLVAPLDGRDVPEFVRRAEVLLSELLPSARDLEAVDVSLAYASGVEVLSSHGDRLVTRWLMRGVETTDELPTNEGDEQPVWSGRLSDVPPVLLPLFIEDLLWLGVGEEDLR